MELNQYIVDAFTDHVFHGNPAAVCVLPEWIPDALMQKIAQENNLSETAFTVKTGKEYELRWFTPGGEEGDGNLLRAHERSSALLMAAEGYGFDDVLLYYNHLLEHLKWKKLGHVLAGGNMLIGDIKGKEELNEARQLGASIR